MEEMGTGRLVFVTGGARSGKSGFALRLAESMDGPRRYIATARPLDDEMGERIRKHRKERGQEWETVEEPLDIAGKIALLSKGVVLLDCVTLWLTNLIGEGHDDNRVVEEAKGLVSACRRAGASVIAVSNEVGLGIVPDNALARRFRDLSGTVNQELARAFDEVYFVASGIPLRMK